jgi:alkanesulfonate monooxygenase SsuD/methylene tetrahydromethanopterin reductase-like flavin-dependent oxidoreductase (luciferase family)
VGEDEADVRRRFEHLRRSAPPGTVTAADVDEYRQGRLVGTVEQVREQLALWEETGVTDVVACLGAVPFSVTSLDDVDLLGALAREGVT